MANEILLNSSIIFGGIHFIALSIWRRTPWYLKSIYTAGVFSSLLNHGASHPFTRYLDRIVMPLGLFTDIMSIHRLYAPYEIKKGLYFLLGESVGLYLAAKFMIMKSGSPRSGNLVHICAHGAITLCHVMLCQSSHLFPMYA